jgi:hypothetical protein
MEPKLSPHALQKSDSYYTTNFTRILDDNFPQTQYSSRRECNKTAVSFGQRSLLISEIEFLTIALEKLAKKKEEKCNDPNEDLVNQFANLKVENDELKVLVIYAGAAGGKHLRLIIELFPSLTFLFIDPSPFFEYYSEFNNVTVDENLMTNERANKIKEKYKEYKILYISDIRDSRFEKGKLGMSISNQIIIDDMHKQREWYEILDPEMSYLKFRLPYPDQKDVNQKHEFEYLDGHLYFLPWSRNTSTETRLLVTKKAKTKTYNILKYEQQMFRYNVHERVLCYEHDIQSAGIDHCYDCFAEISILKSYLDFRTSHYNLEVITINQFLERINSFLQTPNERLVRMYYQNSEYDVWFNSMSYGKTEAEIFTRFANRLALQRGSEYRVSSYEKRFHP